jgi:hypothetical protein
MTRQARCGKRDFSGAALTATVYGVGGLVATLHFSCLTFQIWLM